MKKLFLILSMTLCLVLGGCSLSLRQNPNGVDMTPRIIQISENIDNSQLIEIVMPAIVAITVNIGNAYNLGSGVCVKDGGYIITNQHVISGARGITLHYADNTTASASIIWQNSSMDLAIIKSSKNMPYLQMEENELKVGDEVFAIGTPLDLEFKDSVTKGIISGLNRELSVSEDNGKTILKNLIQHDANINPGNSGGPLINRQGKVIGINTLKASEAEGMGFAIPITAIKDRINNL